MTASDLSMPDDAGRGAVPRRLSRRRWTDARFAVGLLLIAGSVVGVWAVVGVARQTTPVLAAARTIVPGQRITADDLVVVDVSLGRASDAYVRAGDPLDDDAVATRTVASGELVPRDALSSASKAATTSVVVESSAEVPRVVRPGAEVEVWAAPRKEERVYGTPAVLVRHAVVSSVDRDDSLLGGGTASLELVISRTDVADVLAAVAAGSAVSVIPAGGAG